MRRIKVAVLCGGPSSEWEVSMKSGAQIAKNLPKEKYDAKLVQITPDGRWMLLDRKKALNLKVFGEDGRTQKSDLKKFGLFFIGLHGKFGEDGRVQSILETVGVPYTCSGVMSSAVGMNKLKTNELAAAAGLLVPKTLALPRSVRDDLAGTERRIRKLFGYPFVVKPNESGSSVGVAIVRSAKEIVPALGKAFREDGLALVQEFIPGRELTCGVLGNSGGEMKALPPVEIISHADFFDYEAKYNSKATEELCPAPVSKQAAKQVSEMAMRAHEALGCDGLTRSDFILGKNGKLYFLEINTVPGMTEASLCPKEARAAGMSFGEFLDRIAELALSKHAQ